MSTVITKIMHKLRIGNDAGRITTDDRGQNVWEWNNSDETHGSTSVLIKSLENDDLEIASSPGIGKKSDQASAKTPRVVHSEYRVDAAGEPIHTELNPILSDEQAKKIAEELNDDRATNKFGKKVDDEGGFDPYG